MPNSVGTVSGWRRWFAAPVFPEDEERSRTARVLYPTILITIAVSIALHLMLTAAGGIPPLSFAASWLRIAGSIAVLLFIRSGWTRWATTSFIGINWVAFALSIPFNGGVYAIGYRSGFLILIIIAALLVDLRTATLVALISAAYGLIVSYFFPSTEFLSLEFYKNPYRVWALNTFLFALVIVFIRATISSIRETAALASREQRRRLATEETARATEQNYREVFNATTEAIFIHDPATGAFLDANTAAIQMFGVPTKEDLLDMTVGDLSSGEGPFTRENALNLLAKASLGIPQVFEWQAVRTGGIRFWCEITLRSAEINGEQRILAVMRDITEKKAAQAVVQESLHRMRLLSEAAFEGIGISVDGRVVEANEQLAVMLGYARGELIGRSVAEFVAPESEQFVRERITSDDSSPYEHLALRKDGSRFWVEVRGRGTMFNGRPARITVVRDIELQKRQTTAIERSSHLMENLINAASRSAFISTDLDGTITAFNPGAEFMLGYSAAEMVGKETPLRFHDHAEVDRRSREILTETGKTVTGFGVFVHKARIGQHEEREWTYVRKNGSTLTVSLVVTPIFGLDGMLSGFLGIARDISEQREANEALRRSEELFSTAFNNAPLLMTISTHDDGRFITVNNRCLEYTGYEPREIIGRTATELGWISEPQRQALLMMLRENGNIVDLDLDLRRKDGTILHRLYNCEIITINGVRCLLSISLNVTDRKRAEEQMAENKERYRHLFEFAGDAILILDEKEFLDCNAQTLELFRCSRNQIIGRHPSVVSPPEQPDGRSSLTAAREQIAAALEYGTQTFEWVHRRMDGTDFFAEVSLNRLETRHGVQLQAIVRDISERKQAEERIRLLAHAVTSARECICIADLDERILFVNNEFQRTYGYHDTEVIGRGFSMLSDPSQEMTIIRALREKGFREAWEGEFRHRRSDGSEFPVSLSVSVVRDPSGEPEALIAVISDLTRQKQTEEHRTRLEEQLRHSQKMEAFGRLAGGIAHDFNNMLTPILGFGELLRKSFDENDPRMNRIQQIIHAAESSKHLISNLLAFARRQNMEMRRTDLNTVIANFQKILVRTLREDIIVRTELYPDPQTIIGDAGQIEQVVLNLSVNAMDAMPHGGTLTITTHPVSIPETLHLDSKTDVPPGDYAVLTVTDTGSGIPAGVAEQIFEPFFTTKEKGKGTGLGLSTVYGIVQQHNGVIAVESAEGKGTRFTIHLPLVEGEEPEISGVERPVRRLQPAGSTVLVVEDQDLILELVCEVLGDEGYTVFTAANVADALAMYERHRDSIDLLITDIILPDGNGKQLYETIAAHRPSLRVLFMSSYTEDILSGFVHRSGITAFIPKPFSLEEFSVAVERLLRAPL